MDRSCCACLKTVAFRGRASAVAAVRARYDMAVSEAVVDVNAANDELSRLGRDV